MVSRETGAMDEVEEGEGEDEEGESSTGVEDKKRE